MLTMRPIFCKTMGPEPILPILERVAGDSIKDWKTDCHKKLHQNQRTRHVSKECPSRIQATTSQSSQEKPTVEPVSKPSYALVAGGSKNNENFYVPFSFNTTASNENQEMSLLGFGNNENSNVVMHCDSSESTPRSTPVIKRNLDKSQSFTIKPSKKFQNAPICPPNERKLENWNFEDWKEIKFSDGRAPLSSTELLKVLQHYDQDQSVTITCDKNDFRDQLFELKNSLGDPNLKHKLTEIMNAIPLS
ncbi:unnamed protein product [Allacma fusca]|uniref:Uncharacterized protein n=1 Tax=Allacma fusca TaxID=39272 RepID=A0A8J2JC06_9HEXA|nr:unnamed protein product [Allacma fusca]